MSNEEPTQCLICESLVSLTDSGRSEVIRYECPRCGTYDCTTEFMEDVRDDGDRYFEESGSRERTNLSAWLRGNTDNRNRAEYSIPPIELDSSFFDPESGNELRRDFEAAAAPTFHEKADRLLLALEQETDYAGQPISAFASESVSLAWQARAWALNSTEFESVVRHLIAMKRVASPQNSANPDQLYNLRILPDGWKRIEDLASTPVDSKQGFVAMWFGDEVTDLYTKALAPAIRAAGYTPLRIDEKATSERIDDRIEVEIKRSRFVVADVTELRGGVYYEAGFARGLNIPVIWTCREDRFDDRHFDTMQFHHEKWTEGTFDQLTEKLRWRIENICGRGPL